MGYKVPGSLSEALSFLSGTKASVIAGGTDFFPALGDHAVRQDIVDISRLSELRSIAHEKSGWRIGAAARWTDIVQAELPPCFDGLKSAALEVGSWQIQNAGTIAGNICNASPAADGVPVLLSLDAAVELQSAAGCRVVRLGEFITGVRRIDLHSDEIVTAILIPDLPRHAKSAFLKLGSRKFMVISIAMVGAVIWMDGDQRIEGARVAVGSCSAVASRLPGLEAALIGKSYQEIESDPRIWADHLGVLSPISDVRGSREYRLEVAQELCKRVVLAAIKSESPHNG